MADYQDIRGLRVKYLSADPSDPIAGEVWYNSTTGTLKSVVKFSAWSSATGVINAYPQSFGGGTTDAGWIAGGYLTPPYAKQTRTEEYNGSGWAVGGTLNTARADIMGAGLQTAALAAMGDNHPAAPRAMTETEEYNGSSWTNVNPSPGGMFENAGGSCGTQTAYMAVGGRSGPPQTRQTTTMEYNGSTWSTTGAYPAALGGIYNAGTQTAALGSGGEPPPPAPSAVDTSATYDGATWTAAPTAPLSRRSGGRSGSQTAALLFGGSPGTPAGTTTLTFDGTTFAVDPASLANPMGGQASSTNSPGTSAWSSNPNQVMEEYNFSINTVTPATWAAGATVPTTLRAGGGAGITPAGLIFGGNQSPSPGNVTTTLEYDSASWTAGGVLPGLVANNAGVGTQTAALSIGGKNTTVLNNTNEYNGSSWTATPTLPTATDGMAAIGTTAAAAAATGTTTTGPGGPGATAASYNYNGSTWTAGNAANTLGIARRGFGTSPTAGALVGGYSPPGGTYMNNTEEYNGTSWSSVNNDIYARSSGGAAGVLTDAIAYGGEDPAWPTGLLVTSGYDGTHWSTRPSLTTQHWAGVYSGAGSTDNFCAGGGPSGGSPDNVTTTEEYSAETSAATVSTLTTS